MYRLCTRFLIALTFALFAAGFTLMAVDAQNGVGASPQQKSEDDCAVCHTKFQVSWTNGSHGQAGSDPAFIKDWTTQGKPGACLVCHTTGYDPASATWKSDSVSCSACHLDNAGNHPKTPMTIDRSPDLCGRCHSDTRFGWQAWQGSTHYQRGMNCITCHDPHSASLKLTVTRDDADYADASQLCITCHQEASMQFPYTEHYKKGVSCVDCHLEHYETKDYAAHAVPDHSFKASLETCNACHVAQMHMGAEAASDDPAIPATAVVQATPMADAKSATSQPTPVSPIGYASLAGLIGLAGGMVLAPWLEKIYRREAKYQRGKDGEEDENEQQ